LVDAQHEYTNISGRRIAIDVENKILVAFILILVDGLAKNILLLPAGLKVEEKISYIREENITAVFSDLEVNVNLFQDSLEKSSIFNVSSWFQRKSTVMNELVEFKEQHESIWLIPTSGTTGKPKLIAHTLRSLTRSINYDFKNGEDYCWAMIYDICRFAGLQVFLQSLIVGSGLVFIDKSWSISNIVTNLIAGECNVISATPTMFRKLMFSTSFSHMNIIQLTLGGEIVDQKILSSLSELFPNARIVHIYALTEFGVGFSISDGLAGFPIEYNEAKINGVDIKISTNSTLLVRANFSCKKIQENINTDKNYTHEFMDTGDLVKLIGRRYFFLGRENGTINVGGNKVQPEEIEQIILELPQIKMVSVSGKYSSITGEIVVAFIVLAHGVDEVSQKRIIHKHCRERLCDFKIPAVIKIVDKLEINKSGKLIR